jgi:hypothetical protein
LVERRVITSAALRWVLFFLHLLGLSGRDVARGVIQQCLLPQESPEKAVTERGGRPEGPRLGNRRMESLFFERKGAEKFRIDARW